MAKRKKRDVFSFRDDYVTFANIAGRAISAQCIWTGLHRVSEESMPLYGEKNINE